MLGAKQRKFASIGDRSLEELVLAVACIATCSGRSTSPSCMTSSAIVIPLAAVLYFDLIVERCIAAGLVWGKVLCFDASKVEANA